MSTELCAPKSPANNHIGTELLILAPLEVGAFKWLGGRRSLRVKPAIRTMWALGFA